MKTNYLNYQLRKKKNKIIKSINEKKILLVLYINNIFLFCEKEGVFV